MCLSPPSAAPAGSVRSPFRGPGLRPLPRSSERRRVQDQMTCVIHGETRLRLTRLSIDSTSQSSNSPSSATSLSARSPPRAWPARGPARDARSRRLRWRCPAAVLLDHQPAVIRLCGQGTEDADQVEHARAELGEDALVDGSPRPDNAPSDNRARTTGSTSLRWTWVTGSPSQSRASIGPPPPRGNARHRGRSRPARVGGVDEPLDPARCLDVRPCAAERPGDGPPRWSVGERVEEIGQLGPRGSDSCGVPSVPARPDTRPGQESSRSTHRMSPCQRRAAATVPPDRERTLPRPAGLAGRAA